MRDSLGWGVRLFPVTGSQLYVRVMVFALRRDFEAYARALGFSHRRARDLFAFCAESDHYYRRRRGVPRRRHPLVADVVFWQHHLGVGLITHEFFHATAAWARRLRIPTAPLGVHQPGPVVLSGDDEEERLARVQEALVRRFVQWADAAGLYGPERRVEARKSRARS